MSIEQENSTTAQFAAFWSRTLLIDQLGTEISDRIEPDAMLIDDLGADSLDMCDLQSFLQEHGLEAPDEAFTNHMRVRDLSALLLPTVECALCLGAGRQHSPGRGGDPDDDGVPCERCNGEGVEDVQLDALNPRAL